MDWKDMLICFSRGLKNNMKRDELIGFVNSIVDGKSKPLPSNEDCFAVNASGYRGIAIETKNEVFINESFNKVDVFNCIIDINSVSKNVVFLCTKEHTMQEQYGLLCIDFIENKDVVKTEPIKWFNQWKELIGNVKQDKMVYDFVGEMKTLLLLQKQKINPKWTASQVGTFDISSDNGFFEVKSTISKTTQEVVIHNQYQLSTKGLDKNLYIAFCKLEENDSGDSIDSLVEELVEAGFSRSDLDKYLTSKGYGVGKSERKKRYLVHEIRKYIVDDNFPRITKESFIGGSFPKGITKFEYTISLDALNYEKML